MELKLYHVSQDDNHDYDVYDSMVVCAKNENEARQLHPGGYGIIIPGEWPAGCWSSGPDKLTVRCIGVAAAGETAGVICASFNAG